MAQQTYNYPKDKNGQIVKIGDKVRGFGSLRFQDGFEIDRTPIVTANLQNGILYFGNLSAKSFTDGFEIVKKHKQEFDEKGNVIYWENSDGKVIDKRPKCENKVVAQQTAVDYLVNLYYTQYNVLLPSEDYEQAKQMEKQQIMDAHLDAYIEMNMSFRGADRAEEYYNETYGK